MLLIIVCPPSPPSLPPPPLAYQWCDADFEFRQTLFFA